MIPNAAPSHLLPPSSLVICTYNRPQMLRETVDSILKAEEVPTELIIIDQSDAASTSLNGLENSRGCVVHHTHLDIIGASYARNVGFQSACYEWVVFIDDDMRVDAAWYGELIRALIQGGTQCVVTGRIVAAPSDQEGGFVVATHDWEEPAQYTGRIGKDVLASGDLAIHRSAYGKVGGFDERLGPGTRFPGAEDNDFGYRLLEAGYEICYEPRSVIYHRAWRSRKAYVPLFWNYGRGQGAFYAKHWNWRDGYMASRAWKDISRYMKLLPQRIWQRQLLVLLGSTAFLLGEWVGSLQWLATRGKGKQ